MDKAINNKSRSRGVRVDIERFLEKTRTSFISVMKDAKSYNILKIIITKYFGNTVNAKLDKNDKDDDETKEVKDRMSREFSRYKTFIDIIRQLARNVSTNEALNRQIDDYVHSDPSIFGDLMEYVSKKYVKDEPGTQTPTIPNVDGYLKIGATYSESESESESRQDGKLKGQGEQQYNSHSNVDRSPKYTAYVYVDLVRGEINNTNKGLISCSYQGEYTGRLLEQLDTKHGHINKHFLSKMKVFDVEKDGHVGKDGKVIPQIKDKPKAVVGKAAAPPKALVGQALIRRDGGGSRYKRNNIRSSKTRKCSFYLDD